MRDVIRSVIEKERKEKKKKEGFEKYKAMINSIRAKVGKPVPPKPPKFYKIVKERDIKMKERKKFHEVLVSKFHRSTTLESIKDVLLRLGFHPTKLERIQKKSSQHYNVFVSLPTDEEVVKALTLQRFYFRPTKGLAYILPSRRPNPNKPVRLTQEEHTAKLKEEHRRKIAEGRRKARERREQEAARKEEERQAAEAKKLEEAKKVEARKEEEAKKAEEARKEEEAKNAESAQVSPEGDVAAAESTQVGTESTTTQAAPGNT